MNFIRFFLFSLLISVFACTPKITEEVVEDETIDTPISNVDPECQTFDDIGVYKQEALESFVIYKQALKNKEYDQAYEYWKKAFRLAPGSDGKKTYHYSDGVEIYAHYYELATSEEDKKMWLDSVNSLYERRVKCFGSDPSTSARHAFDLFYDFGDHVDKDYLFNLFKETVDITKDTTPYFVVNPFTSLLVKKVKEGSIEMSEGQKYADQIWKIIEVGNENCGNNCAPWEIINSYAPDRLESLEAIEGFYGCEYYTDKYYPLYEQNPEECDVISLVRARLNRGNCDPNGPELVAINESFSALCSKSTEKGLLGEAKDMYMAGNYDGAIEKYKEYLEGSDNVEKNADINLFISKIYYRDLKNYPMSRQFAREAAKLRSNWGEPFILIGKLYASSGPICGPGTGWDSQIVTWPAIDKWQYAKSIDPSVASEANKLIGQYQKYMPSSEDIFFRPSVTEGMSFTVGCWINETTKVRAAK